MRDIVDIGSTVSVHIYHNASSGFDLVAELLIRTLRKQTGLKLNSIFLLRRHVPVYHVNLLLLTSQSRTKTSRSAGRLERSESSRDPTDVQWKLMTELKDQPPSSFKFFSRVLRGCRYCLLA